jgi:hypothetical protein
LAFWHGISQGEMKNAYKILDEELKREETNNLGDLGVDGGMILKWILEEYNVV